MLGDLLMKTNFIDNMCMSKYVTDKTMVDLNNNITSDNGVYFWNDEWNSSPHGGFNYKCCQNCPNNPKNNPNASGICHCTLPSMETIRY